MFVDELQLTAKAGDGGDGVVRWHRYKFKPKGGPAGGNGGRGGDVYIRAVRDLALLSKYTGAKQFVAESGGHGQSRSKYGKGGDDLYIDLPVGSKVTDIERGRVYELSEVGQTLRILRGGNGGLGNEHFKSSVQTAPEEATKGQKGEEGSFTVELSLIADVGLVGLPNAGKSSLLNVLTNASSQVGSYEFTTLEPHLGTLHGVIIADIPGLIEGAHEGKGLGHKFLRHISRTKMLLHLISLEHQDPLQQLEVVRNEMGKFENSLLDKETWIVLTKKDLVEQDKIDTVLQTIDKNKNRVFVISTFTGEGVKNLQDELVKRLQER